MDARTIAYASCRESSPCHSSIRQDYCSGGHHKNAVLIFTKMEELLEDISNIENFCKDALYNYYACNTFSVYGTLIKSLCLTAKE